MENLKIEEPTEISKVKAFNILRQGFPHQEANEFVYQFSDGYFDENTKNLKFELEKTGRKGSTIKIENHPDGKVKADIGKFLVRATWDFIHPTNFAQNENNITKVFEVLI